MLLTVLALIVLVICGGCVYAFVHAIFLFIFSHGDEEKKKSAWNGIRYMIIGIILTIFLLTVFPVVFSQLKVTGYEAYTAKNVFQRA
jgi:multisubunit Na+/H+ antiporter MnhB subunit